MAWVLFFIESVASLIQPTSELTGAQYTHLLWLNFSHLTAIAFLILSVAFILAFLAGSDEDGCILFALWLGTVIGLLGSQMVLVSMNTETWEIVDWTKANIGFFFVAILGWL